MIDKISDLEKEAANLIENAATSDELVDVRIKIFGRKGKFSEAVTKLSSLPVEKRAKYGNLLNSIKEKIERAFKNKNRQISKIKPAEWIDVTAPAPKIEIGHLHPVTIAISEIVPIFEKIGFTRVAGSEVEWDYYAFESLNMPKDHPARDEWETLLVQARPSPKYGEQVLTPHTSSAQVREMEKGKLPIRMLAIFKNYRRQSDVSHTPMFHQFEGLVVDKGISIANLKGVLDYFVKSFFGPARVSRIRPFHFQFTEPSFEVDVSCGVCDGKGCRLCKQGWLELGGAGMVHPKVLAAGHIDPTKYSGFAFGWGVERTYLMKEGLKIDDLRILYQNDIRFLEQF